ncbi:hypothetical protein [Anaerosalibacter sp. Marseille-P3206]|uniref:hypothetical protein n=1 Tax=Anaerosalibacter sp. Marseille-P3206 TaxID=1871005 RepID=UPI000985C558|nr:hypothetical protein [Anaerosalibacter sp. Marseille-P3206]
MKRKHIVLIFIFIIAISFVSCKKESSKNANYEKKEKAPSSLNSIYEGINSVFDDLEELNTTAKEPEEEKEKKEEKLNKSWENMNKTVKEIHHNWNSYEIEGAKKVPISEGTDKLEESLNKFTLAVENKEVYNIISNGSQVYLYISPYFDSYKDEIKGELCKIKYYVFQSYLMGESGELDKANELLSEGEVHLTSLRNKIGEDKNKVKVLDKLSFSLQDLKKVLKENNSNLLTIKRDIILKNIKQLEK